MKNMELGSTALSFTLKETLYDKDKKFKQKRPNIGYTQDPLASWGKLHEEYKIIGIIMSH